MLDYSAPLNTNHTASQGRPSYSISVNYASPIGLVPYFTIAANCRARCFSPIIASGAAHYNWRSYRVSFFIDNIFNKHYYIPQRSSETEGSVMPGEGRAWSVKFTAKF